MQDQGGILELSLTDVFHREESSLPDLQIGPYSQLTVADTGNGIEPTILDCIFDPFFTTKEPGVGTGLGLSVVHGIAKNLGGTISVEGTPGKGATFQVLLPTIKDAQEVDAMETASLPPGRERILLVDDEAALALAVKQMLEHLGYEVTHQIDSLAASETFSRQPKESAFDLVITDMTMPHLTGVDLARELLKRRPGLPIILCTGFSEKIDMEKARSLGIQGFLMKPVQLRELAEMVRKVLTEKNPFEPAKAVESMLV